MFRNKIVTNFLVYLLLIAGYLLFYAFPVDKFLFEKEETESSSKVNFIYQQF